MIVNCYRTKNATVVSYPAFSGGKFLTNCLSLSKHACPQNPEMAEYLLKHPADYDYRLGSVLKSLPDKSRMKNWLSFEFGDMQLYGKVITEWVAGNNQCQPNKITQELCESNLKFFMVDHSIKPSNLLAVWPNATVIKLINTEKFQSIAVALKCNRPGNQLKFYGNYCRQKYNLLKGNSWPNWEEFENHGYDISQFPNVEEEFRQEIEQFYPLQNAKNQVLFNMDDCIFDTDKFLNSMQQLYAQMGFDDFQQHLVKQFYTDYISLHI